MTTLEIIDSAVKIGLGAALTGITTLLVSRAQRRHELAKERIQRTVALLQQIAQEVESCFHAALRRWATLCHYVRRRDAKEPLEDAENEARIASDEFFDAFRDLTNAEAKLMLIGASEAANGLKDLGEAMTIFRRDMRIGAPTLTLDGLTAARANLREKRVALFSELSKLYRNETKA